MGRSAIQLLCVAILSAGLVACAAKPGQISQTEPVSAINQTDNIAVKGHDPVAYFVDGKPVPGHEALTYEWQGTTYRFASAENRQRFIKAPKDYAPQYGGYCAFAMSRGHIADISPEVWSIVDGKLYLNNNSFAHSLWKEDIPGNIAAADKNWPLMPKL